MTTEETPNKASKTLGSTTPGSATPIDASTTPGKKVYLLLKFKKTKTILTSIRRILKVNKFRKQIMVSKLLPKTNQTHYPGRLLP